MGHAPHIPEPPKNPPRVRPEDTADADADAISFLQRPAGRRSTFRNALTQLTSKTGGGA